MRFYSCFKMFIGVLSQLTLEILILNIIDFNIKTIILKLFNHSSLIFFTLLKDKCKYYPSRNLSKHTCKTIRWSGSHY